LDSHREPGLPSSHEGAPSLHYTCSSSRQFRESLNYDHVSINCDRSYPAKYTSEAENARLGEEAIMAEQGYLSRQELVTLTGLSIRTIAA
jgi:hypothetical protein